MTGVPVLQVQKVSKAYGSVRAIDQIELTVSEGEVVCIIGPSGCGKSTLLRCINFLEEPDDGLVLIDGAPVGIVLKNGRRYRESERRINRMRTKVGIVFQYFNVWPNMNVLRNVTTAPIAVLRQDPESVRRRAEDLLDRVGLSDKLNAFPAELSGGQLQRVAIARALAMEPRLMLFDEATSSLDPEMVAEVLAVMRDVASSGMAMAVVTHEIGFASNVADRIVFMNNGKIEEEGSTRQVLHEPKSERLRIFLSKVLYEETLLSRIER